MTTIEELNKLKAKAEESRREAERAAGALEQVLVRLKREFGCSSLKVAEVKEEELAKEEVEAEKAFVNALTHFKKRFEAGL